jgi:uncharacterized protein (DUF2336 family)
MSAAIQGIEKLEVSFKSRSSGERFQILHSVTDLFVSGAAHHSDVRIELFDDVLCRLVQYVEAEALARLSAVLAPVDTAPPRVVGFLARHDEIAVAGPLLRQSKRLQAGDLIEIASTKSQAHLVAIGNRPDIDESVTDVLVERGDTEVARTIATNAGARFSPAGFSRLVTRARSEDGLARLVAERHEISPAQLCQLARKATDIVRQRLLALAKPDARERIESVLARIEADIDGSAAERRRDYSAAQRLIEEIGPDPERLRSTLVEVAEQDEFEATVAVLAALAGLSIAAVERVMDGSETGGALLLCRATDLQWPAARAILSLHATGRTATPQRLRELAKQFSTIDPSMAQRVVRFWRVRNAATDPAGAQHERHDAPGHAPHADDWSDWTLH